MLGTHISSSNPPQNNNQAVINFQHKGAKDEKVIAFLISMWNETLWDQPWTIIGKVKVEKARLSTLSLNIPELCHKYTLETLVLSFEERKKKKS